MQSCMCNNMYTINGFIFTCTLVAMDSHALNGLSEICIKTEKPLALLGEPFDLCLCSHVDPLSTRI